MKPFVILVALGVSMAPGMSMAQKVQAPPDPKSLYEAGQYEPAIQAIAAQGDEPSPAATYLAGQSHLRLNQPDAARAQFAKLSAGSSAEKPTAWSLVGTSATALIGGDTQLGIESAKRAVQMAPDEFHPNYQLGLAYSAADQMAPAAEAFEKAAAIDPTFAYTHYYAGLAYSKLRQVSRMATHLEYFLKLAPEAPERPAVVTLMRRVR